MVLDENTGIGGDRWSRDLVGSDLMRVRESEEGEVRGGMRRGVLRSI